MKANRPAWALIFIVALWSAWPPAAQSASSIAAIESSYADWLDALGALGSIDSGSTTSIAATDRDAWAARRLALSAALNVKLQSADRKRLNPADSRALRALRKGFMESDAEESGPDAARRIACAERLESGDAAKLQLALYACFEEIGSRIAFAGSSIGRTAALQLLQELEGTEERKHLFMAFSPLWEALNGTDRPDSPYRRMIRMTASFSSQTGRSPFSDAAATLGIAPAEIEPWLLQILTAWRARNGGPAIEPWDYWYDSARASREVSAAIGREQTLAISKRFFRDLGADLDRLGVEHDLEVRDGKAPLAYTELVQVRRLGHPAVARVSANYDRGGLFVLNELIHEDGHAVHYSALRTRPAYFSLGDDLFFEAFADVPAWSSSEPLWQQKYLGEAAKEGSALRELFSNVLLDVAWSLFELRMFKDPTADPNAVWTEITSRYLNIVAHPELSWWALRVQLVRWPGYMINYGLGAVVTADIRQRTREAIGQFDSGNPRWYPWSSAHLLRFGSSVETRQLLRSFLGRAVSPAALLRQLRRVSADRFVLEHLEQAPLEQRDGLVHVGLIDDQRRHEAHGARAAGQ